MRSGRPATVATVVVFLLIAGVAIALHPWVGIGAVSSLALLGVFAAQPRLRVLFWPVIGVVFFILAITKVHRSVPTDTRMIALVILLFGVVGADAIEHLGRLWRSPLVKSHSALVGLGFASSVWSMNQHEALTTALGAAAGLLAVLFVAASLRLSSGETVRLLRAIAIAGVLTSLALWAAPSNATTAYVGGRLSAVFENPNGLGLFSVFAAVILFYTSSGFWRWSALFPATLILLTGSRAAIISLIAAALAPTIVRSDSRAGRRWAFVVLIATLLLGIIWVLNAQPQGELPQVLRKIDSRSEFWTATWSRFLRDPILGGGLGAWEELFSVNSYLLLASELGLFGIATGAVLMTRLWSLLRQPTTPPFVAAYIVAGLTNGLFESWLFRGGSPFFVLYWLPIVVMDLKLTALSAREGAMPSHPRPSARRNAA